MKKASLIFFLLFGCAKHVPVKDIPAIVSPDHTWMYYPDDNGDYVVVSKVGSAPAVAKLCPRGNPCTVERVGETFVIRRLK